MRVRRWRRQLLRGSIRTRDRCAPEKGRLESRRRWVGSSCGSIRTRGSRATDAFGEDEEPSEEGHVFCLGRVSCAYEVETNEAIACGIETVKASTCGIEANKVVPCVIETNKAGACGIEANKARGCGIRRKKASTCGIELNKRSSCGVKKNKSSACGIESNRLGACGIETSKGKRMELDRTNGHD